MENPKFAGSHKLAQIGHKLAHKLALVQKPDFFIKSQFDSFQQIMKTNKNEHSAMQAY